MEEIEVVIKIPKILYAQIQSDAEIMIYSGMRSWKGVLATLLRSVRNGTPLPKGHGALKDANELNDYFRDNRSRLFHSSDCRIAIDRAETIIEADKN